MISVHQIFAIIICPTWLWYYEFQEWVHQFPLFTLTKSRLKVCEVTLIREGASLALSLAQLFDSYGIF